MTLMVATLPTPAAQPNNTSSVLLSTWIPLAPLFVPIDYIDDITSHLSESEHTGLSELLANKDALLALLNS